MRQTSTQSRVIRAGDPSFQDACLATLNKRIPQFPEGLYQVRSTEDIQQAIQLAKDEGLSAAR